MGRILGAVALLTAAWADWAVAQEFRGAELSAEFLAFNEGDDVTSNNYRGSGELGVFDNIALGADLSFYDFGDSEGVRNITLHALYDAFSMATVGAFYARDSSTGQSAEVIGVEAARSFGAAGVEGYVGFGEDEGKSFTTFGLDGALALTRGISVTASGSAVDMEAGNISRVSVGGEYRFGDTGPAVYASIGRLRVPDGAGLGDSIGFIGIGGRVAIGPNRGTTFESRGLYEALGSF